MRRTIFAVLAAALLPAALIPTSSLAGGTAPNQAPFGNVVNLLGALVVANGTGQQPAYSRLEAIRSITWSQAAGKVVIRGGKLAGTRKGDYRWLAPLVEISTGMEDGRATKGASDERNQRWPVYFRLTRGRVIERYSCSDNPYGVEPALLAKSYDTGTHTVFCG